MSMGMILDLISDKLIRIYLFNIKLKSRKENTMSNVNEHPKCYEPNGEVYPLCKGNKGDKCHDCCINEDY